MMRVRWSAVIGVVVAAAVAGAAGAREAKRPAVPEGEGVIDPKADAALKRMSDYLSGLQSLRLETTTIDEKVTAEGQKIQELRESRVAERRPNKLRVDRVGPRRAHGLRVRRQELQPARRGQERLRQRAGARHDRRRHRRGA